MSSSIVQCAEIVVQRAEGSAQSSGFIYVARRGWHIDIGFAVAALEPPLRSLAAQFPGARYVFFGFGDKHYLLAKNRNGPVLLGALWPGPGMLLVTALNSTPEAAFGAEHVIAVAVTTSQVRGAQAFIQQSLKQQSLEQQSSEPNAVVPYAQGPYEGSLYFAATPTYSAFHTCNTWVAEALKTAPLPIHSAGVIFAGQLWGQVRRLAHRRAYLRGEVQLQGGFDPS
jgi:Protein of unknown function (DUF2459)